MPDIVIHVTGWLPPLIVALIIVYLIMEPKQSVDSLRELSLSSGAPMPECKEPRPRSLVIKSSDGRFILTATKPRIRCNSSGTFSHKHHTHRRLKPVIENAINDILAGHFYN